MAWLYLRILPPLAVGIAAVLVLLPTMGYGFTNLDDDELVLDRQPFLTGPSAVSRAFSEPYFGKDSRSYYRPIVTLSFMADARLGGAAPAVYHRTNLLLHALASMLLYLFLRRLRLDTVPALFGALLFALHPVHAASCAWIPGRNDILLTIFALGAALSLPAEASSISLPRTVLHALLFAAALLSKETAFILPLLFIGMRYAEGFSVKAAQLFAVWGTAIGAVLLLRARAVETPPALFVDAALTAVHRIPVLLSDLGKVVFPFQLQVLASPKDLHFAPGIAAALLLGALIYFLPRLRSGRTAFAAALFLLPSFIGLAGAERVVLENRLYLPIVGLALFLATLLEIAASTSIRRRISTGAAVVLVALFARELSFQLAPYENPNVFAARAIRDAPNSGIAVNLLRRSTFQRRPPLSSKKVSRPPVQ